MAIVKPVRPGTYIDVVGETIRAVPLSISEVAAVPITAAWGPWGEDEGGVRLVQSPFEFDSIYGSTDTSGRRAVHSALYGSGAPGNGGAGGVLVYRLAGSAKARSTVALGNTTPASPALTLTARYYGADGNRLIAVVEDYPTIAGMNILKIYRDAVAGDPVERFIHPDADINNLAAQINLTSRFVSAVANVSGVALALTAGSTMTGGNSGLTLTSTDYVNALSVLRFEDFSLLAFENLTDSTIQQSVLSWLREQVRINRPVTWVVGGALNDTLSAAITRSTALADPRVVNLGVGNYTDFFVTFDVAGATVSTAQLAPRIAGLLIARGRAKSLTFARVDLLKVVGTTGPTASEIEQAIAAGVTVFSRAQTQDAFLKVEKGVSTFTRTDIQSLPFDVFSDPRLVRVLDLFVREVKKWGDDNIIGNSPVNDASRAAVKTKAATMLKELEIRGLIVPGSATLNVPVPTEQELRDSIPFDFGWLFEFTATFVFGHGKIA